MDCAVCGQPGASVCTAVDDYGYPVGEWTHTHCFPQHGDSFIECNRLGGISKYHSFSRGKAIVVPNMRRGSPVLFGLAKPRILQRAQKARLRFNLC